MYRVTLPIHFDGERYGMKFFRSVGETDNERIADILKGKGFEVVEIEGEAPQQGAKEEPVILSLPTLEQYAADNDTRALIEYAHNHGVGLGNASKADTILKKIVDAGAYAGYEQEMPPEEEAEQEEPATEEAHGDS